MCLCAYKGCGEELPEKKPPVKTSSKKGLGYVGDFSIRGMFEIHYQCVTRVHPLLKCKHRNSTISSSIGNRPYRRNVLSVCMTALLGRQKSLEVG